jgi:hypothetical protein
MSVLLQVLLAPVASQERLAILTEIAAAWRLPLVQPAVRDAAGGFSLVDRPADFSDVQAIERLARRCVHDCSTGRRGVSSADCERLASCGTAPDSVVEDGGIDHFFFFFDAESFFVFKVRIHPDPLFVAATTSPFFHLSGGVFMSIRQSGRFY